MAYLVNTGRGLRNGFVSDLDSIMNEVFGAYSGKQAFPAVDIRATEDGYVIEAEVPGLTRDEVVVRVEDNLLILESNPERQAGGNDRRDENGGEPSDGEAKSRYLRRERRRGGFRRSFALPRDVDGAKIEASYANGVLSLTLPKREEAKPRAIKIQDV